MNSPAGEPQGPKRTPLLNPLPVRRGEGEATPRSLSALIQRQWGRGEGYKRNGSRKRVLSGVTASSPQPSPPKEEREM